MMGVSELVTNSWQSEEKRLTLNLPEVACISSEYQTTDDTFTDQLTNVCDHVLTQTT